MLFDINMPKFISNLHSVVASPSILRGIDNLNYGDPDPDDSESRKMLHALAKIIGFNLDRNKSGFLITVLSDHHVALVDRYAQARLEKDWPTADGIRDQLAKDGIILSVARDGTVSWRKA